MKPIYKIILFAVILIIGFFIGRSCSTAEPIKDSSVTIDSLARECAKMDVQKKNLAAKLDSIALVTLKKKEQKTVYVTRYKDVLVYRDSINGDSAKSVQIFDMVKSACDSVNSANDSIISSQDLTIATQESVIGIQEQQLKIKDTTIAIISQNLAKSTNDVEKLQKKVKRNRVIATIATGIAAIEAGIILLIK